MKTVSALLLAALLIPASLAFAEDAEQLPMPEDAVKAAPLERPDLEPGADSRSAPEPVAASAAQLIAPAPIQAPPVESPKAADVSPVPVSAPEAPSPLPAAASAAPVAPAPAPIVIPSSAKAAPPASMQALPPEPKKTPLEDCHARIEGSYNFDMMKIEGDEIEGKITHEAAAELKNNRQEQFHDDASRCDDEFKK